MQDAGRIPSSFLTIIFAAHSVLFEFPPAKTQRLPSPETLLRGLLCIHLEFCCGVEKCRQTHGGIARDASLSFDDGRNPVRWHFEGFSQRIGIDRWI